MTSIVYRVEGNALAGMPDFLTSSKQLTLVSTSASDTGQVYLECRIAGFAFYTETVQLQGTTPVLTSANILRVNRAYYIGSDTDTPTVGEVTVKYNTTTLATIAAGDVSAWDCVYSIDPGLADVKLGTVTPGVTIKHRQGQSPFSVTVITGDQAPGIGDFWAEGTGFAQFELTKAV